MALTEDSVRTTDRVNVLLTTKENSLGQLNSIHNDKEDVRHPKTPDPEAGPVLQSVQNQEGEDEKFTNIRHNPLLNRVHNCVSKLINTVPGCSEQRQLVTNRLNVLFSFTTLIACMILLCLYIVRSQATDLPTVSAHNNLHFPFYKSSNENIPLPSMEERFSYPWNYIQQLFEKHADKSRLHIQVLNQDGKPVNTGSRPSIAFETHENTLKILGRPTYCIGSGPDTPENVHASNTTHLYMSQMNDCHHYAKLVLTRWKFPKVRHVKLHKMLIREQEFHSLTNFIERHNETLHRVEIDECFLCPSPICDMGLINFPEHDFQITITRRRESPDWI